MDDLLQPLEHNLIDNVVDRNGSIDSIRNSFKQERYVLMKRFLPEPLPLFFYRYVLMQAHIGVGMEDTMVPNAHSIYGDPLMESSLDLLRPVMESLTGIRLDPTYAYARLYTHGDILPAHIDRPACEISATVTLGYDVNEVRRSKPDYIWPIFLEGKSILMEPGDMVIYRGCELHHWREAFEGQNQAQLFMHYVDQSGKSSSEKYDKRPALGLPPCTKGTKTLEEAHKEIEKEYKIDLVVRKLRQRQRQA